MKARLVVRRDLQDTFQHDTGAFTLAAGSFQMLMALMAGFDLDAIQLDVKNAFLNAVMTNLSPVYVSFPEEIKCHEPKVFELKRAVH